MAAKHKGLGRGLSALIKDAPTEETTPPVNEPEASHQGILKVPTEKVKRSPWQPRTEFNAEALEDLTHSIREHGIIQPLVVRMVEDYYELIAGERRWRAAQNAELKELPVIIMDVTDKDALELALIENLQREDLNAIEIAEGYKALADKFDMTQEHIAQRVGKGRATIANALRLLSLPDGVKQKIADNSLSSGHAKVLLSLDIPEEQNVLAERCVKEQLSVRSLERIVQHLKRPPKKPRAEKPDIPNSHITYLTDQLHHTLGTSVRLTPTKTLANGKKTRGCIEIDFYSNDDLERVLTLLGITETM